MEQKILDNITVEQGVRFGKPVIEGTRVPVELIIGKIAGGMAIETVMREYALTREQVFAALKYAAKIVAQEELALV